MVPPESKAGRGVPSRQGAAECQEGEGKQKQPGLCHSVLKKARAHDWY